MTLDDLIQIQNCRKMCLVFQVAHILQLLLLLLLLLLVELHHLGLQLQTAQIVTRAHLVHVVLLGFLHFAACC